MAPTVRLRFLYLALFLTALGLAYGAEWAPYYLSLLLPGEIRVIGDPSRFAVPCTDPARGSSSCRAAYRLPAEVTRGWGANGAIGLGIVLYTTEVECLGTGAKIPLHSIADSSGQNTDYLTSYQVYYHDEKKCPSDILVKAWGPPAYRRFGHTAAPLVVGDAERLRQVKNLVEFFLRTLLQLLVAIFLVLVFFDRNLVKIAQERGTESAPERYALFWIGYMVLVSNILNTLAPISLGPLIGNKAQHVLAWNAFAGILLFQLDQGNDSTGALSRLPGLLIRPLRWLRLSPLNLASIAVVFHPSYNGFLATMILTVSAVSLAVGLYRRDELLSALAACELADALKLYMVPGMPMYYTTMIFVFLAFSRAFYERVRTTARVFETLKWTQRVIESYHEGGKIALLLRSLAEQFSIRAIGISQRGREGACTLEAQVRGAEGWEALHEERSAPLPSLAREVVVESHLQKSLGPLGRSLAQGAKLTTMKLEHEGAAIAQLLVADYPETLMSDEVERLRFRTSLDLLLPFLSRAVAQKMASEALSLFLPQGMAEKLIEGRSVREVETGYLLMVDLKGSTRIARRFGNDHWAEFTASLSPDITLLAARFGYTLQFVVWDAFYFTRAAERGEATLDDTVRFARELHEVFRYATRRAFGEFAPQDGPAARFCLTWGDTTRDVRPGHKSDWTIVGKTMAAVCKLEQACKEREGWLFASTAALPRDSARWEPLETIVQATEESIYRCTEPVATAEPKAVELPGLEAWLSRPRKSAA